MPNEILLQSKLMNIKLWYNDENYPYNTNNKQQVLYDNERNYFNEEWHE